MATALPEPARSNAADLAIRAHGLVKHFGPVVGLDGVDLAVQAGTVPGLLGPNGAGKTTAVRILTTILEPDAAAGIGEPQRPVRPGGDPFRAAAANLFTATPAVGAMARYAADDPPPSAT